jgi:hypothetical protein
VVAFIPSLSDDSVCEEEQGSIPCNGIQLLSQFFLSLCFGVVELTSQ